MDDVSQEDLENKFSEFGEIAKCYLLSDRETGESRGLGVVEYNDKDSFRDALQDKDLELNGNTLSVYPYRKSFRVQKQVARPTRVVDGNFAYRNGFNDGRATGYNDGFVDGYNKGYEDHESDQPKDPKKDYLKRPYIKKVVNP